MSLGTVVSVASAQPADDTLKQLQAKGVVKVATTLTSRPWSYLNDQNEPDGYDVAVATEIFKRLGVVRVEIIADKFANFVESLTTAKYDLVVSGMANTPDRAKKVDFTVPYSVQDFRIWVSTSNQDIHDIPSLSGKSVGVSSGTSNELWAHRKLKESEIRGYEGGGLLFSDLSTRRLDSVIASFFVGEKTRTAGNLPIKAVGDPVTYSLGAIIVPRSNDSLREAIDVAIGNMIQDGTLQSIGQRYLGENYDLVGNMAKANADW
ncbi:transporter substrate-binding domain-containing protein [Pseudomonas sp. G.S.17]|uniref:transporter substrate-binding domain-containing protein n=1 Tax=Pseudomonas sp. G.S.17 TaxID=3137451 RepID=UPI00311CA297